jgi:hypothetical protein
MRRILWDGATNNAVVEVKPVPAQPVQPQPQTVTELAPPELPPKKQRSTNGHEAARTRALTDAERDLIRSMFIEYDGQFAYGQCSKDILPRLGDDVTPWQVSGFLSQIHVEVYKGLLKLKNPVAYYELMATKYPRVHERYMKKYGELVAQQTDGNVPQFAHGVPRKKKG